MGTQRCSNAKQAIPGGIDDQGLLVVRLRHHAKAIGAMNMPMDQIAWLEAIHKRQKGSKSAMGSIGSIMDPERRRVCQQHIQVAPVAIAIQQQAWRQAPHPKQHLCLGKLGPGIVVVADAPAQASQDQATVQHAAPFNGKTATRLAKCFTAIGLLRTIMVAQHIQARHLHQGDDKLQVVKREITTPQHGLHISEALFDIEVVDQRYNLITYSQELHCSYLGHDRRQHRAAIISMYSGVRSYARTARPRSGVVSTYSGDVIASTGNTIEYMLP